MKVISLLLFAILAVVVLEVNGFYEDCSCPKEEPCEVRFETMPPTSHNGTSNSTKSLRRRLGNSRIAQGRKANKRSKPRRTSKGSKRSPARKSNSARRAAKRSATSANKPRQVSNRNVRAPSAGRRRQASRGRKAVRGRRSG